MRTTMMLAFAALLVAPVGALANEGPVLAPTKDVSVVYHIVRASGPGGTDEIKLTYIDHNQRVRLDFYSKVTNEPIGAIIFDAPRNRLLTLDATKHLYYQVPATGRANPGLLLNVAMHYERLGSATIAGLSCTDWKVSNGSGYQGTACVTADGIALRATRSKPAAEQLEAIKVTYGEAPASSFEPGPGYTEAPQH